MDPRERYSKQVTVLLSQSSHSCSLLEGGMPAGGSATTGTKPSLTCDQGNPGMQSFPPMVGVCPCLAETCSSSPQPLSPP